GSFDSFTRKDLGSVRPYRPGVSAGGRGAARTPHQAPARVAPVLLDPDVREWHATMELKKTGTADERGRVLYRYCKALKTDPASIVASARDLNGGRRSVERKLQNFVVMLHGPHKPSDHGEDDRDGAARER